MELTESDIPESVFLELSVEDPLLSLPDSEPVTILLDEFFSDLSPYPVTDIVSEHGSDAGCYDGEYEVFLTPESSDEYHHVHPWYCRPDDRE